MFASPGFGRWDRIVATEALICLVLIAATPILGKSPQAGGKGVTPVGVPSTERALVRLTATLILFMALSLVAQSERAGKAAALFGGIVTLAVAGNSVSEFQALAAYFGGTKKPDAAIEAGGGPIPPPPGGISPTPTGAPLPSPIGVLNSSAATRGWAGAQ